MNPIIVIELEQWQKLQDNFAQLQGELRTAKLELDLRKEQIGSTEVEKRKLLKAVVEITNYQKGAWGYAPEVPLKQHDIYYNGAQFNSTQAKVLFELGFTKSLWEELYDEVYPEDKKEETESATPTE